MAWKLDDAPAVEKVAKLGHETVAMSVEMWDALVDLKVAWRVVKLVVMKARAMVCVLVDWKESCLVGHSVCQLGAFGAATTVAKMGV